MVADTLIQLAHCVNCPDPAIVQKVIDGTATQEEKELVQRWLAEHHKSMC